MKTIFDPVIDNYRELQNIVHPNYFGNPESPVCIIDMGHGGIKDGDYTTFPNKMQIHLDFTFLEGVWNRCVGWNFALELYNASRNYIILVPEDDDTPISRRIQRIKSTGEYLEGRGFKPYVVSIHADWFGVNTVNGVSVYTSPGNTLSDPIAIIYFGELDKLGWRMRSGMEDGDVDKEACFGMLIKHKYPAILLEIGFYSNEAQAREMCDMKTINEIATLLRNADCQINLS